MTIRNKRENNKMIYIKLYRVTILENGRRIMETDNFPGGERHLQIPNDYDKIDILDPLAWRHHLANEFLYQDKLLPHKASGGERIHYEVYMYGVSTEVHLHFKDLLMKNRTKKKVFGKISLFPGYLISETEVAIAKDIRDCGWIRKDYE